MNSNFKQQAQENSNQIEEETKQCKTFTQDVFKIDYVNTSKIMYQLPSHCPDVKVNNYLCYQEGQNLFKITEVIYEDKLIRIEDKFEVCAEQPNVSQWASLGQQKCEKEDKKSSRNIQKVRMFNKNASKEVKAEKRDKKNIVKNVVKIFSAWLEKKADDAAQCPESTALEQLQNLLQHENYNNRLIKKIAENREISRQFVRFLEDGAQDQIKYSRIQDKESHYQALQIYKTLLSNCAQKPQPNPQNPQLSSSQIDSQSDQKYSPSQMRSNKKGSSLNGNQPALHTRIEWKQRNNQSTENDKKMGRGDRDEGDT